MVDAGPTRGATEERRWSGRPVRALAVRGGIIAAPILSSFAVVHVVAPILSHPAGRLGLVFFFAQAAVIGSATALLVARAAGRLLPLTDLLNMTLVFPDRAPSRFSLALRSGTLKQLRRSLEAGDLPWADDHQEAAEQLVALVASLGSHERLTRGHTERVRAYADLIGEELGLGDDDRELLHWAAMVHDIGKLTVPAEILSKNGFPTEEEWDLLRQHPTAGGRLLEPLAPWLGEWRLAASQHHERWDGLGYPNGLAGTEISLSARIVAVADAFDVITSSRSYKKAMSAETARLEMVRLAGTQFDPDVVRALLRISLTKDRAALGFLGWFSELGGLSSIPRGIGQAIAATTTAAVVVAGAVGGVGADELFDTPPVEAASASTSAQAPPLQSTHLGFVDGETATPTPAAESTSAGNDMAPTVVPEDEPATTGSSSTTGENTETGPPTTGDQTTTTTSATPTTATMRRPTTTTTTAAPTTSTTSKAAVAAAPSSSTSTTAAPAPTVTAAPTTTPSTAAPTTTTTAPGSPLAADDDVVVQEHKDISIDVLANDDPGNSPFDEATLVIITDPQHAEDFRVHNDHIHYKSVADYIGSDSIEYRICNTNGLCHTATVNITTTA